MGIVGGARTMHVIIRYCKVAGAVNGCCLSCGASFLVGEYSGCPDFRLRLKAPVLTRRF